MKKIILCFIFIISFSLFLFKVKGSKVYTESELSEGVLEVEDYYISHTSEYYTYNNVLFLDNGYLLFGSYKNGKVDPDHNMQLYYPYVSFNTDEEMIWDRPVYEAGLGEMVDGIYYNGFVYAIGNTYDYHDNYDFLLCKLDSDGKKQGMYQTHTNNETKVKKICVLDDYIIVIGWTMATDLIPNTKVNLGTIFVSKFSLDLELLDMYYYGTLEDTDELIDVITNNEYIYIYAYFARGKFYNEGYAILKVDSHLDECGIDYFDETGYKLIKCFDGVAFVKFDNKINRLIIKKYDKLLYLERIVSLEISKLNSDVMGLAFNDSGNLLVGMKIKRDKANLIGVGIIDKDLNVIGNFEYELEYNNYIDSIHINDKGIYVFDKQNSNSHFHASIIKYLKKNGEDLFFNGNLCTKEIENLDTDTFGKYVLKAYYHYNDETIVTENTKEIKPNFSVINGETYDIGHVLTFNGEGYLNDKPINNNYKIDNEGVYTLKVIGNNNEMKLISFSVRKLCIDCETIDNDIINVNLERINTKKSNESIDIDYKIDNEVASVDNKTNVIFLVIIISSISFLVGLFIPVFKKGRHHDS